MFWLVFLMFSGQSGQLQEKFVIHEDLYEPSFLQLDKQGRIFSSNSEQNILVFDKNGTFIRKLGRKGQGPGEFTLIKDLGFLSDGRLLISDSGARKILIMDADGGFIEALPMSTTSVGTILVLPDDSFVLNTSGLGSFTMGNQDEPEPRYFHFDLAGNKLGGYGVKVTLENPMATVFANLGFLVRLGDDFVHAGIPMNDLIFYQGDRERRGHYAVPFVPFEMETAMDETTGSDGNKRYTMRIKADTLCRGLVAEPGGGLLMLRAVSSVADRDPNEPDLYNLVRLSSEGKTLKVWEGAWEARHLALGREGKDVFFVNELDEDTAISKLTL